MSFYKLVRRQISCLGVCLFFGGILTPHVWTRDLVVCDDVSDPATLDPQKQFSEKNHTLLQQIFEGLVRFDPDGKIEPALAESWERIDPLRVRFFLRKGVKFHNGENFTAESVRYTIERYLNPNTGFPALGFISSLSHAEVVDDHTVDIVTFFPDGLLLNRLAGFVLVVPPSFNSKTGENTIDDIPNGTGAFRFVSWEKGKRIILKANTSYWDPQYPKISGLEFRFLPLEDQIQGLFNGKIDVVTELPGTRTTETMEKAFVIKKDTFYTVASSLNLTDGPLADKRVRQALNFAINREEIIRYDLLGNGTPLATMTMPGEEGHDPTLKPYEFSVDKARDLLKISGYPSGFVLNALVKEQAIRTAKIVKKQLEAIGVDLNIRVTTDSSILVDSKNKKWDMIMAACPDPMSHSFFIQSIVLYSKSPYALSQNKKFDLLLEDMAQTLDREQRKQKAVIIDKLIYNEALSLFTFQRLKTYGVSRKIRFSPPVTGMPHFYSITFK